MSRVPTWVIVALLASATVLSRLPLLTPRLAHWDAVNYALGLHDFNVAAHQPHPPGSPYFIMLGRAALAITGDDNSALILVSLVASAGAVIGEYALARTLFGMRAALLSALVLMTQPVFWGYGTMATSWTLLACLAVVIGLVCAALMRGRRSLVVPSALLLGFASGFRLDVTVFLGPLWLFALQRAEPDPRRRLLPIGLVAGGVLLWLVPVAIENGGLSAWSERMLALLPSTDASPSAIVRQLAANTAISFGTLAFTIGPALLLAAVSDWRRAVCWLRNSPRSAAGVLCAIWIAPAFTFLWLVDSTEPGHDLIFTGALCALGVGALVHTVQTGPRLLVAGSVLLAAQVLVFLSAAPVFNRPLAWTADSMLLDITAPGLRQQQASLGATLQTIRGQFDPADTLVVTLTDQDPYRFMMYYLPEYPVVRLDPVAQRVMTARDRRQGNWQPASCLFDAGGVHNTVWVLSATSDPGLVPEGARLESSGDGAPFQVWVEPARADALDYLGFRLTGPCNALSASS